MQSSTTAIASRHLRDLFSNGTVTGQTDGQLLARYATRNDGSAFEARLKPEIQNQLLLSLGLAAHRAPSHLGRLSSAVIKSCRVCPVWTSILVVAELSQQYRDLPSGEKSSEVTLPRSPSAAVHNSASDATSHSLMWLITFRAFL
jgi:hypothetical protein